MPRYKLIVEFESSIENPCDIERQLYRYFDDAMQSYAGIDDCDMKYIEVNEIE